MWNVLHSVDMPVAPHELHTCAGLHTGADEAPSHRARSWRDAPGLAAGAPLALRRRMERLAWIVLAVAGCGSGKIGYLDSLDGRAGGGVIVLGELSTYDGLAEKLHTYVTRVELDRDGNVRAHDDLGEQRPSQRVPKPDGPRFGDGTRLEVLPFADDSVAPL